MSELSYDVLVVDGAERHGDLTMPDGSPIVSSPCACTLILGASEAVLCDPPFTNSQIAEVGDWIADSGRRLSAIYATHGHGDHWFGAAALIDRFPGAVAYATEGTMDLMAVHLAARDQFWDSQFPGQIPETPIVFEVVPEAGIDLEGHPLIPIEVGHSDTVDTTVLHVPSIGLVVAGDVVYNGVHQMLLETGDGGFDTWLAAIDAVEALEPRAVVAGHKNRDLPDDPRILDETRDYLHVTRALIERQVTPMAFYEAVINRFPDRLNPGPVWYGGLGLLGDTDIRQPGDHSS